MAGRKIQDQRDARECLAAAEASGVSRAEWSRQNGVDGRSLNAWKVNLERRGAPATTIRMLELVPAGRPAAEYRVRCGSFVVEVGDSFDDRVLARLLTVVSGC